MSEAVAPIPWDDVTAYCLHHLRMRPADVWALTFRELLLLLPPAAAILDRATLNRLAARFPDG